MPGSDFEFRFRWVPNTYPARIQRASVLYPLMGIAHTPRAISAKTRDLVDVWRARAASLVDAGWTPRKRSEDNRSLVYARNCVPAFVYAVPSSRPCNQRAICPFCYARWVREVWVKIDSAFPYDRRTNGADEYLTLRETGAMAPAVNDIPRTHIAVPLEDHMDGRLLRSIILDEEEERVASFPYHLVEIHAKEHVPFSRPDLNRRAMCRRILEEVVVNRARRMRRIHSFGSFAIATVVPSPRGWRIRQHELHQVAPDYVVPAKSTSRVIRYDCPTRRNVFHAVAHACRYPKELLYGDPEGVAILLACRRGNSEATPAIPGVRLSAMYGSFRTGR